MLWFFSLCTLTLTLTMSQTLLYTTQVYQIIANHLPQHEVQLARGSKARAAYIARMLGWKVILGKDSFLWWSDTQAS